MGLFLAVAQGSTRGAALHPSDVEAAQPAQARRPHRQGRHLRLGRPLAQVQREHARHEDGHGRRRRRHQRHGAPSPPRSCRIEVHAIAACTENMPSGRAYKLGDVLRSKAGKTVEINNTDAEGRLTLADAISYALELKPDAILDFATLTGACIVALGPHTAGVMSNNDALATAWLDAAKAAGDDMWRLPLPDRLLEQLKSDVADMKNTGERWGGALTAGLFLREFVGDVPWVHVDIAGPSTADKDIGDVSKGGTGFPRRHDCGILTQACYGLKRRRPPPSGQLRLGCSKWSAISLDCSNIRVVEFARLDREAFFR